MADPLLLAMVAVVAVQGAILAVLVVAFLHHRRGDRAAPPRGDHGSNPESPERGSADGVEDLFLLHRSGLLLKHYTRRLRPTMDSDVLSGLLFAIQESIKDSFRGEGGRLDEIRFGAMRIKVVEGKWTILASIVRGEMTPEHASAMAAALRDLEAQHEDLLVAWDGTMDQIPEVDRIMMRLVEGGHGPPSPSVASA